MSSSTNSSFPSKDTPTADFEKMKQSALVQMMEVRVIVTSGEAIAEFQRRGNVITEMLSEYVNAGQGAKEEADLYERVVSFFRNNFPNVHVLVPDPKTTNNSSVVPITQLMKVMENLDDGLTAFLAFRTKDQGNGGSVPGSSNKVGGSRDKGKKRAGYPKDQDKGDGGENKQYKEAKHQGNGGSVPGCSNKVGGSRYKGKKRAGYPKDQDNGDGGADKQYKEAKHQGNGGSAPGCSNKVGGCRYKGKKRAVYPRDQDKGDGGEDKQYEETKDPGNGRSVPGCSNKDENKALGSKDQGKNGAGYPKDQDNGDGGEDKQYEEAKDPGIGGRVRGCSNKQEDKEGSKDQGEDVAGCSKDQDESDSGEDKQHLVTAVANITKRKLCKEADEEHRLSKIPKI